MATITDWDPSKMSDYSSVYPFLGTEIAWLVGAIFFWLFFHWILFKFDTEDCEDKKSPN